MSCAPAASPCWSPARWPASAAPIIANVGAGIFVPFMTNGAGFIGIVLAMLARGRPLWVLVGALLFGVCLSLTTALQVAGINMPTDVIQMLPFVAVMIDAGVLRPPGQPAGGARACPMNAARAEDRRTGETARKSRRRRCRIPRSIFSTAASLVLDGYHVFWNRGPGGEVRFPVYSILIEHDEGRFLIDTGYDYDHVMKVLPFEKPIQTQGPDHSRRAEAARARAEGHRRRLQLAFPFRPLRRQQVFSRTPRRSATRLEVPQACNPAAVRASRLFRPQLLGRGRGGPRRDRRSCCRNATRANTTFEGIDGDVETRQGRDMLIFTPGHSIGHYALMVEFANRTPDPASPSTRPTRRRASRRCARPRSTSIRSTGVDSMRKVKKLAEDHDAELMFSHDMESFKTYQTGTQLLQLRRQTAETDHALRRTPPIRSSR